jgi:hypothetical protein
MPAEKDQRERRGYAYVLPQAFRRNGTVVGTRKERLACAFIEVRDRIRKEVVEVAKEWQVSAQELRRDYSYAYPPHAADEPDAFNLEHACEGVIRDLRCNIQTYAEQFWVPDDLLEAMLVDWLVSDQMGWERTPVRFFVPEEEGSAGTAQRVAQTERPGERPRSIQRLLAARAGDGVPGEQSQAGK